MSARRQAEPIADEDDSDGMGVPDWVVLGIVGTVVAVGLVFMHIAKVAG